MTVTVAQSMGTRREKTTLTCGLWLVRETSVAGGGGTGWDGLSARFFLGTGDEGRIRRGAEWMVAKGEFILGGECHGGGSWAEPGTHGGLEVRTTQEANLCLSISWRHTQPATPER